MSLGFSFSDLGLSTGTTGAFDVCNGTIDFSSLIFFFFSTLHFFAEDCSLVFDLE